METQVYELIRDRIVRSELAPGSKLRLRPLAEELGVSTMPVRAALHRLAAEGLVENRPSRGAVVTPLDFDAFVEIQDIRIAIEGLAARLGTPAVSEDDLEAMRAILGELRARNAATDLEEMLALEWEGYLVCYRASARPRLVNLIIEHGRLAERYSRALLGDSFDRLAVERFAALVDACAMRDAAAVERVVIDGLTDRLDLLFRS